MKQISIRERKYLNKLFKKEEEDLCIGEAGYSIIESLREKLEIKL